MEIRQETALPVKAKVKLTLCTDDRFFGPGVCELLERIRETGSIQAAAARMDMSYSKAWKILKHAEETMGTELITRVSGGRNGGWWGFYRLWCVVCGITPHNRNNSGNSGGYYRYYSDY